MAEFVLIFIAAWLAVGLFSLPFAARD